ncbi:hypothetical protein BZZ08_07336 [Streptomyces sp. MH60]|nr:hypothetical protein BZZ08_07336 [Streptomyces sp. MH60]
MPGAVGSSRPRPRSARRCAAGSWVTWPYGGPHTSRSSTSRDSSGSSARSADMRLRSENRAASADTAETESWVEGRPTAPRISWIRPGDIPAVASRTVGPSPVGDGCCGEGASSSRAVRTSRSRSSAPHTSACSRSRAAARGSAAATAGSSSSPPIRASSSPYDAGSGATASASAVCSVNRSSRSSARTTEARVPARAASWVRSVGTGVMRSGRLRRRAASETSSLTRSASARDRGAADFSSVLIRSTLAGGSDDGGARATVRCRRPDGEDSVPSSDGYRDAPPRRGTWGSRATRSSSSI